MVGPGASQPRMDAADPLVSAVELDFKTKQHKRLTCDDARASMEIAPEVARIMAADLERDDLWAAQQVKSFCELARGSLFP